jgi:DNA mismatch repair protein MutH
MMKAVPTAGSGKHMEMAMLIIGMLTIAVGVIVKLAVVYRIDRIMGWVMLPLDKLLGATQGRDAEI